MSVMETGTLRPSALCPLINTARLKPIRQQLNTVFMTITESGHVLLEVKGHETNRSDNQLEVIKKLVRISPDGYKVEIFRNIQGVVSIDESHLLCHHGQVYTYPNLSDKLWKKYQYAHKFVEVMKSRTAKIVLITDKARCKLMENSPNADFQVCFPDGVTLMLSKLKVTLTDQDGSSMTFSEDLAGCHVNPDTLSLLEYSHQCRDQCLKIEKSINDLHSNDTSQDFFPITIGPSSQPCWLSDQPLVRNGHAISSPDVQTTRSGSREILLHQDHAYTEDKYLNQPAFSEQSHDYNEDINNFQHSCNQQQLTSNCLFDNSNKLQTKENVYDLCKPTGFTSTPKKLDSYNSMPSKVETYQLSSEMCSHLEDLNGSRNDGSNLKSYSSSTPQKLKIKSRCNLQSDLLSCKQHLLFQCADKEEENLPTKTVHCDDYNPSQNQKDISEKITDNCFVHNFKSECNIQQQNQAANHIYACNCNKCIGIVKTVPEQLTLSPICHQNPFCRKSNSATCNTKIPDSTANQYQNGFATPQKSSVSLNFKHLTSSSYFMKHRVPSESIQYNFVLDTEAERQQLQNVRRTLFSEQTSEEQNSSHHSTSDTNVTTSDFLDMSKCSKSEASSNLNVSPVCFIHDNQGVLQGHQRTRPQSEALFAHENQRPQCEALFAHENQRPQSEMLFSHENQRPQSEMLFSHENQRGIPQSEVFSHYGSVSSTPSMSKERFLVTTEAQSTPVKAPSIANPVVMYPGSPDSAITNLNEFLALPLCMDNSIILSSTQSSNLSASYSDKQCSFESFASNKPFSEIDFPDLGIPVTQQKPQGPFPEVSASPRKPVPVRKTASLSPLKMSSKFVSESSIQKNLVLEHTKVMPSDFFQCSNQSSPVRCNETYSSSSLNQVSGTAHYKFQQQSRESLISPKSDPGLFRKTAQTSNLVSPYYKGLPTIFPAVNNWTALDLPILPHVRNSLDISSDGRSSPPSSASDVICQVFVPYTGWASFYATGTIWILYNDGTQLGVKSSEATMTYIDQDGGRSRYMDTDVVPDIVKLKLEKLPKVVDILMRSQATTISGPLI